MLCDFQIREFQSRFMRLSSSLFYQFPVLSTIPVGTTSIRTILSFIRIIRAVAHFYGNFFVRFFCLELFRVNFFSSSLPATSTCSSIRYTFRDSFFFFSFLYGFAPFVPFSMPKKRVFVFRC